MIGRIRDLAETLAAGPLVSDEVGDDVEQAAVALQALTAILVQRDLRAKMARWETTRDERGRLVKRLRPDQPPTPEEAADGAQRFKEIAESGQAPAAHIWDPESTRFSAGRPMGKAEYRARQERLGKVEVSGYDVRNDIGDAQAPDPENVYTEAEVADLLARAEAHGKATGQLTQAGEVVPNSPVIPMEPISRTPTVTPKVRQVIHSPKIERVPLEQRKPVDVDSLRNKLLADARAKAMANIGVGNGTAAATG